MVDDHLLDAHIASAALGRKMHGIAIARIGFTLRRNARRGV
jgi:hypothetical protein